MNTAADYKGILLKKSFWLFAGRVMPVVVLFIITIFYSRVLNYEDYGKFQSIWMYTNLLNVIISFGITSLILSSNWLSLNAFVKRHSIKITSAYVMLLIFTSLLFILYGKNFTLATKSLLILFVIIQSTSLVTETLLIKFNKEKPVFIINVVYSLLFLCWHYYILLYGFNVNNLITGIIIISIFKFAIILFLKKQKAEKISAAISDNLYYKHWVYLGLNDIAGVFSRWIDKLLLVYLLTAADFALFFNGSFEIPLFGLLVSVTGSIMLIELSNNILAKEKVKQLFIENFRLLSLIVFPLFLFLLFFRSELFAIIFKHKYDASVPIFLISIFILPVRINNFSSILQCYQQGNKIMAGSLLDISIAIILMVLLYPILGTKGVALAIVIATYCQVLYYLWQSAILLGTNILSLIPVKTLIQNFIIMLLIFSGLYFSLHKFTIEVRMVTGIMATVIIVLISLYIYFKKQISY